MSVTFSERLCSAIESKQTAVMVGIDPRWDMLPEEEKQEAITEYGPTLEAVAHAYYSFCNQVINLIADHVPVVKFQVAFFEAAGPVGLNALERLMSEAKKAGLLVVADAKRSDIGSTAEAYAQAWLGKAAVDQSKHAVFDADALTVNPYLGAEGVDPFLKACDELGKGLFVLVRTSNPGAGKLQDLKTETGRTVYQLMAQWVYNWNGSRVDSTGYGPVGAVVGATVPDHLRELRLEMPHSILLIPGYGAQGGTAADIACAFDSNGMGAVVNNSRGILFAYQQPAYANLHWRDAVVAATINMRDDLAAHTSLKKLKRG